MPIKGQSPKQIVHTEMHKFKHGSLHSGSKSGPLVKSRKQAIAIALSESGQSNKKHGGSVKRYVRKYADGGDLPDVGEPLIPSGGQFSAGNPTANRYADAASKVIGNQVVGGATLPYRYVKTMVDASRPPIGTEASRQGMEDVGQATGELGMNMFGAKGGPGGEVGHGVFVGPYGAMALKNRAPEGIIQPHPVVANEFSSPKTGFVTEHGPVKLDEPSMSAIQDIRDEQALRELQTRASVGIDRDRDVFQKSGWSLFRGKPVKEIVDSGAKLIPWVTPNGTKMPGYYRLDHPAGDIHSIYDLPPIRINPKMDKDAGATNPQTNEIVLGSKNVPTALHEIQHVIAKYEGLPRGSNAKMVPQDIIDREHFPGEQVPKYQSDFMKKAAKYFGQEVPPETMAQWESAPSTLASARAIGYFHDAGENLANNVSHRYKKPLRYNQHPEDTELVPRGLQTHGPLDEQFTNAPWNRQGIPIKAAGGPVGNQKAPPQKIDDNGDEAMELEPEANDFHTEDHNVVRPTPAFMEGQLNPKPVRRYAEGGFNPEKAASIGLARKASTPPGLIKSSIPGRTDKINANVPAGAYIIPADIVSGMGQGNTDAGGAVLGKLMNRGPYNMNLPRSAARMGPRHSSLGFTAKMPFGSGKMKQPGFADGGVSDNPTPIVAAGGEYVVHPDQVRALGAGDLDIGHDILDAFVKHQREQNIAKLRKLPGPKGSKK